MCILLDARATALDFLLRPAISAVIGIVIGYLVYYLGGLIPAKCKWRLSNPEKAKFVLATSAQTDTGKYIRLATGLGQVLAIGKLLTSFVSAYSRKCEAQIQFSANFHESDLKNDLIIVGGTKNNQIAEHLLGKCPNLPYTQKVVNDIDLLFDNRRNQMICGTLVDGKVTEDFGLIISMPNPHNPKTRALLFLSVHTYGLDAAADAFIHKIGFWKNLVTKDYVCLVKCTISNSIIGPPEVLDFIKLKMR